MQPPAPVITHVNDAPFTATVGFVIVKVFEVKPEYGAPEIATPLLNHWKETAPVAVTLNADVPVPPQNAGGAEG